MGWKTVVIGSECTISLSLNRVKIKLDDDFQFIPINDIDTIIFSHDKCIITIPLISQLLENNVNIVICNSKNDPIGVFNAFNNHSLAFKQVNKQVNWKTTRKKKLWRKIISNKIQSEIDVLKIFRKKEEKIKKLKLYKDNLYNDDLSNREAAAAKLYFIELFGNDFNRDNELDIKNYALNYGYKIIASAISKCVVSRGLITQLGIHHIGESNAFNLTYDFIECFRAIIDLWVCVNIDIKFSSTEKKKLIDIFNYKYKINNMWFRLNDAIEDIIDSYIAFLNEEREDILSIDLSAGFKRDD